MTQDDSQPEARTKNLVRRRRSRVNPRQDTSSFMAPVRNAKPSRNAGRLRKRRRSRAIPGRAGRAGTNHDREMDHPRADALPERSPAGPRARCLSVTKPASGMVVGIPPGRAEHVTKPCTGRRSASTAHTSTGLQGCGSLVDDGRQNQDHEKIAASTATVMSCSVRCSCRAAICWAVNSRTIGLP